MMNRNWGFKVVKIAVVMVFAVLLFTYVLMYLWNWLLPEILGVSSITFIQALGLLVLSRLLFASFHRCGGSHKHGHWRHKMKEKYSQLSEEEKRKFKEKFGKYCQCPGEEEYNESFKEEDK